jgi:lysophospholipase L1-like esterase
VRKLFVVGDSISIDYGVYLERMLQGRMSYDRKRGIGETADDRDLPRALAGNNGGDSGMVLEYLSYVVSNGLLDCDILLLNCGLHDIKRNPSNGELQVPLETYKLNLKSVIRLMEPTGVRIYWVRTTPVDDARHNERMSSKFLRYNRDVIAYNEAADEIMAEAGIPSIDLYRFTGNLGDGDSLYCDHVHFTHPVRMQQAAFIAGHLYADDDRQP